MASIRLDDVHKVYPNGHVAARGLDLEVADGEFVVLVGPSGCGKSTALRMVAGLETPTEGRIFIGDRDVTAVAPQDRDIAMVFQTYALYPHKTVRDNLAFGLRMRKTAGDLIERRVVEAARTLGLEDFLDRKPVQLSGGQRQRVALGRAIVREPKAFLLDEPLSNLDAKLRVQTRAELARMHRQLGATMLYVTHDQEEAMTLGDRVAVMQDGNFEQVAPPMEIYRRPASRFVGGFVGSPAMNFVRCELEPGDEGTWLACAYFRVRVDPVDGAPTRGSADLGIRPHDLKIVEPDAGDLVSEIDVIEPLGSELLLHAALERDGARLDLRIIAPAEAEVEEGDRVGLRLERERLHLFDLDSGRRLN